MRSSTNRLVFILFRGPGDYRVRMGCPPVAVMAVIAMLLAGCGATQPRTRLTVLGGVGIGTLRFGQPAGRVAQRLGRLLGRRGSASGRFKGRGPAACGFDHEIVWAGLATTPTMGPTVGLTVYLRRGRFVGYAYGPPYGGRGVTPVRRGPVLATADDLGLGDPLDRGRRLYDAAFIATTQPQGTPPVPSLEPLAVWKARTATGRLHGFIDQTGGHRSHLRRVIGSISAGAVPNTPCE